MTEIKLNLVSWANMAVSGLVPRCAGLPASSPTQLGSQGFNLTDHSGRSLGAYGAGDSHSGCLGRGNRRTTPAQSGQWQGSVGMN